MELHGRYDRFAKDWTFRHSEDRIDRVGKKYQWIAFYEIMGILSDNYKFKDDYASNLYFHMADELISRLIFNNPLIDDIQEISLDIATRRSALLENNSRLFKEYKKQGYKAEQAEDGKYQFRLTWSYVKI